MKKIIQLAGSMLLLSACTGHQAIQQPAVIQVVTLGQPEFRILKAYPESEVVRIPRDDQTFVCIACDGNTNAVNPDDNVIWIKLSPIVPQQPTDVAIIDAEHFDFDKAILKGDLGALKRISDRLIADPTLIADVVGHTDSKGRVAYNKKLGLKRAQAVKRWLLAQGVKDSNINISSRGEIQPIASNKTAAGRARNRRAVITINVS